MKKTFDRLRSSGRSRSRTRSRERTRSGDRSIPEDIQSNASNPDGRRIEEPVNIVDQNAPNPTDAVSITSESSRTVSTPNITETLQKIPEGTLKDILDQEPYHNLLKEPEVKETLRSPLGSLFFKTHMAAQRGLDAEYLPTHEDIREFCTSFAAHTKLQRDTVQKVADDAITTYKANVVNRHFKNFTKNLGVQSPRKFNDQEKTLWTDSRIKTANSVFPLKNPFTGNGHPYIDEWLNELNTAQDILNLSLSEFKNFMRKSSSGEPYQTIDQGFKTGLDVEQMYQSLHRTYDMLISPEVASSKLLNFKATKDQNLSQTIQFIQNLASRSAAAYPEGNEQKVFFNTEASNTLKRCLPTYSRTLANETFVTLTQDLGKVPTYHQLASALDKFTDSINNDLINNGANKNSNGNISIYKEKTVVDPYKEIERRQKEGFQSNHQSHLKNNEYRSHNGNGYKNNGYQNNYRGKNTNYKGQNKVNQLNAGPNTADQGYQPHNSSDCKRRTYNPNRQRYGEQSGNRNEDHAVYLGRNKKLYCGLCGQSNHTPSMGCKLLRDNKGRLIEQGLSSAHCLKCYDKFNGLQLYHPEKYCPGRKEMMELYSQGSVYPAGVFKGAFENYKRAQNQDSHQNNNSRHYNNHACVNMLSITSIVDKKCDPTETKVLMVDTRMKNLTKKLYLSCTASRPNQEGDYKMTGLWDSGSNISLVSRSYLGKIFNFRYDEVECYLDEPDIKVSSYTNHTVELSGKIELLVRLGASNKHVPIIFYVVNDVINQVTPMIFGLSSLVDLGLSLQHHKTDNHTTPYFSIEGNTYGDTMNPESHYLTDHEASLCYGKVQHLQPYEKKFQRVYIPHSFGVSEIMEVIASSDFINPSINGDIEVYPTKSTLYLDEKKSQLYGQVMIHNRGPNTVIDQEITCHFEDAGGYTIKDFDYESPEQLKKVYFLHEVLTENEDSMKQDVEEQELNDVKVNELKIDLSTLPVDEHIVEIPTKLCLISQIFPESVDIPYNPSAVNNDTPQPGLSLSDYRSNIDEYLCELSEEEKAEFQDKKKTIQMGLQHWGSDEDLDSKINKSRGFSVPINEKVKPEDMVNLDDYSDVIRPYVKDIFIDSYSKIIATHSTDRGNLSPSLGLYRIKLRDGVKLPQHKRLYYLSQIEKLQLQSILEFLLKNNTIEKAQLSGDTLDNFSSPSYIIPKSDRNAVARLIINFRDVNSCIMSEPSLLPTCEAMVHSLRDTALHTSVDLTNAFNSITIHPDSRDLTLFSTPLGAFRCLSLPVGLRTSPESLGRFVDKMLNYEPVFDEHGEKVIGADGLLEMKYSPIQELQFIYDDILISTKAKETYEESVKYHFEIVKLVMKRIAYHDAKIGMSKSQICCSRINFFGLFITNNFVCVDPARIEKLLAAPMPRSVKEMRAFHGLLNSLRTSLGFDIMQHAGPLTELTSSKAKTFSPTKEQCESFEKLKIELTKGPHFSRTIQPSAAKIVITDMCASKNAAFSAVLGQIVMPEKDVISVPSYLNLDDKTNQHIYNLKLPVRPLPLKEKNESSKTYLHRIREDLPPPYAYLKDANLGYDAQDVENSLGITLQLLLEVNNCQPKVAEICKSASTHIRKTILRQQYLSYVFNKDNSKFMSFIKKLENGIITIDEKLFIFEALASVMHRPVIVISEQEHQPVSYFCTDKTKPPMVFLLYKRNSNWITRPAYMNKHDSFNLDNLRGKFEIVSYLCKTMGKQHENLHIIDLELMAIIHALTAFRKLIGHAEVLLLSDAKALYWIFSQSVISSSSKFQRWNWKILETINHLRIGHLPGDQNLADYLSRMYCIHKPDIKRIAMPKYVDDALYDAIPKDHAFTMKEWAEFCNSHPEFLPKMDRPELPAVSVNSLTAENKAINMVLKPIDVLKRRLRMEEVIARQQKEFPEIYRQCIESMTQSATVDGTSYYIKNAILFTEINDIAKVMMPESLLPVFIAYGHLIGTHCGELKLRLNLSNFHHDNLYKYIRRFVRACLGCQLHNPVVKLEKFGLYDTIKRPFEVVSLDLIENLPTYRKYKHILTVVDQLSGAIMTFPCKTKTGREFFNNFMFNIYPLFEPRKILCDGGGLFMDKDNMQYFAAIGMNTLFSASHHSRGHGLVESSNKQIKSAMIKFMAQYPKYPWMYVLPLVTRLYNTTRQNKTQHSPMDLLFGSESPLADNHFQCLPKEAFHPLIQNDNKIIQNLNTKLAGNLEFIREKMQDEREERIEKLNKTRHAKNFMPNDLVLVKNRSQVVGVNTALRPAFHISPYRVLEPSFTTTVVQRISDVAVVKLSNNDMKKFKPMDPMFQNLPEVTYNMVTKKYEDLTDDEIRALLEKDDFALPDFKTEDDDVPIIDDNVVTIDDNDPPTSAPDHQSTNHKTLSDTDSSSDEETEKRIVQYRGHDLRSRNKKGHNVGFTKNTKK